MAAHPTALAQPFWWGVSGRFGRKLPTRTGGLGTVGASVGAAELGVVPGDELGHLDAHSHPLGPHLLEHRQHGALERPGVALVDAAAHGEHGLAVVEDGARPHQLHALELGIRLAALHQAGDAGVTPQVGDLLGLAVGPEGGRPVEEAVPHGDEVDLPVGAEGGDVHGVATVEEGSHFVVGHLDEIAAAHDAQSSGFRSSGATGHDVADSGGPNTSSTNDSGTISSGRSHGSSSPAPSRSATASHNAAGRAQPTPTASHTVVPVWRATDAAAREPAGATKASGPSTDASSSTRSASAAAAPRPLCGTSRASIPAPRRRRARCLPSPSTSTTSTSRSARRRTD